MVSSEKTCPESASPKVTRTFPRIGCSRRQDKNNPKRTPGSTGNCGKTTEKIKRESETWARKSENTKLNWGTDSRINLNEGFFSLGERQIRQASRWVQYEVDPQSTCKKNDAELGLKGQVSPKDERGSRAWSGYDIRGATLGVWCCPVKNLPRTTV